MRPLTTALLLLAAASTAPAAELPSVEEAFLKVAPQVLKHCEDKNYRNIAVLKFQVDIDGKGYKDNVGTIGLTMCTRLEMALLMQMGGKGKKFGIIEDANAVAAKIPGATHVAVEGRPKLFAAKYPLYWGNDKVNPDVIVTGLLKVGATPDQLILSIVAAAKESKYEKVTTITMRNQPDKLAELGQSFVMKGLLDSEPAKEKPKANVKPAPKPMTTEKPKLEAKIAEAASDVLSNKTEHPLTTPSDCPISLEIKYDGKEIPFEFRDGKAFAAEPHEGQVVTLTLKHNGKGGRLGCVLKVNGINTLFKETKPDAACRMWLLSAGDNPIVVKGFQIDNNTIEPFRVSSAEESAKNEVKYGRDVGLITLTVFKEGKAEGKVAVNPEYKGNIETDSEYQTALKVMKELPKTKPDGTPLERKNFETLTNDLFSMEKGLIEEGGGKAAGKVKVEAFTRDSTPIETLSILYYKPR